MNRYTLRYRTSLGDALTLHNLGVIGAADIVSAQTRLGSTGFETRLQDGSFDDLRLRMMRDGEMPEACFAGP